MKQENGEIWIEPGDWERIEASFEGIRTAILKERKTWQNTRFQGKSREMLIAYESLPSKYHKLFAPMAQQLTLELKGTRSIDRFLEAKKRILSQIEVKPEDILYFKEKGFTAENSYKATLFARRAAWLRFITHTNNTAIKKQFFLGSREEFQQVCSELIQQDGCFHTKKASLRYLRRLLTDFKKLGLNSCLDKRHENQNARKIDGKTEALLLSIMRSFQKPTFAQIIEIYELFLLDRMVLINEDTGEVYKPQDFVKISESSLYNLFKGMQKKALYTTLHGSTLSFRNQHDRYMERERPKFFGSMITCDDWDLPIDTVSGKKVKTYLFFDVATRHCLGWAWSYSKDLELFEKGLINLLQNPLLSGKMPWELQTEKHIISKVENTYLKEGELFQAITVLPKNPMAKFAETDIRGLKYEVLHKNPQFSPYFKGRHYGKKEAWKMEKDHQALIEKLSDSDIDSFVSAMITVWNKKHPINQEAHPKLLPQDKERFAYWLSKPILSSYQRGIFQANRQHYYFPEIENVLPTLQHNRLQIRFWEGQAYVYQDDKFLSIALPVEKAQAAKLEQTQADKKIQEVYYKNQSHLKNAISKLKETTDKLTIQQKEDFEKIQQRAEESIYTKYYEANKK